MLQLDCPPAAIEKDLWVIIALRAIFNTPVAKYLVFKGGTSLSKGWGIIERFSEDIDLAIDRSYFGFEGELTRTQVKNLRKASCDFVTNQFLQDLSDELENDGVTDFKLDFREFEMSDTDPVALRLQYKSLTENISYLQPRILVEISSRSLREPYQTRELISFIGERYSGQSFADKAVEIPTVVPTRTLLEKIFLLHEELQKPKDIPIKSDRMTRHLYDIAKLIDTPFAKEAFADMELYNTIVQHRKSLNNIGYVDYGRHSPATVSFIPDGEIMSEWGRDYRAMQESMFYGKAESFDKLIDKLRAFNNQINKLRANSHLPCSSTRMHL